MEQRIRSLRYRAAALAQLRRLVGLPASQDILPQQWRLLEGELAKARQRILDRIERTAHQKGRSLNESLGQIEFELANSFTFFDTYLDVLTQRHSPELGRLLRGCDVLAWDALNRDHPALRSIIPPLVYCDRGLGASILREGIAFPDGSPNSMPLIQIPYSRLFEKHTLTSVLHETGHQAMARLGLTGALPTAIAESLRRAGFTESIRRLASLWMGELGPDFWTFCACGVAQASSARELLAFPVAHASKLSWTDPHPPPVLRVLAAFDWCRHAWGNGAWDAWELEWLELYPLNDQTLADVRRALPSITKALFGTKFSALNGRRIVNLFDLPRLAPETLAARVRGLNIESPDFWRLRPCEQLSVFRMVRDKGRYTPEEVDSSMTKWLRRLAEAAAKTG